MYWWVLRRIEGDGFIENQDFVLLPQIGEQRKTRGGHNRKNHHLTLDTAKELAAYADRARAQGLACLQAYEHIKTTL
ncbi:hypothetical protein GBN23_06115 [Plesiomonas shigelloides]|uniref:antA/AntB antirepressor family protein n=1 Tax=Plesiomonas shigelloides TaxID=703 RepID=UPI001261E89F|nr:hypothetical protein GBN23_06115 [Plesiomonas shigelloides]